MKRTLKRIAPLRAAVICAAVYTGVGILIAPFFVFGSLLGEEGATLVAVIFTIAVPVFYAVLGFVGTLFTCWLYNVVVKYTGGMEVEVSGGEPQESISSR